jgi:hypothetical protein
MTPSVLAVAEIVADVFSTELCVHSIIVLGSFYGSGLILKDALSI